MEIQFLDGIDIQLLDGVRGSNDPRVAFALGIINREMQNDVRRGQFIARAAGGYSNSVGEDADTLAAGYDFAGFEGDGSVADEEMVRSYLVRTKRVVDDCPSMVSAYQSPAELSGMLGYVLDRWDTTDREAAISEMADREQRLMGAGLINANIAGDYDEPTYEDYTLVDNYDHAALSGTDDNIARAKNKKARGGLFTAVKAATGNSRLTQDAKDVVAANPATQKTKARLRSATAQARTVTTKAVAAGDDAKIIDSTTSVSGLGSIGENDPEVQALMDGRDLEYMVSGVNPMDAYRHYLSRTRRIAATRPDLFNDQTEQAATVEACDRILTVWNNPTLLDVVLTDIEQNGMSGLAGAEYNGLGKLFKKLAKAIKKAAKKVGSAVKTAVKKVGSAFKKLGKAIAKVTKKVWKFIVRFNPLTLLIRAGILAVCRLNMFKISNKCYPGSLDKATALKKGISEDEWKKSNESYGHLKKAYTAIGGKESKLKSCLEKGNKKKWEGVEYPETQAQIDAAKKIATNTNDTETQKDWNEAKAEMTKQGAKEDSTVSTTVATVTTKEQVEVIENERTTKAATPIRETGETSGKVLATVPVGAKVYVDTAQGDSTWIAATYGTYNGWMLKSQLAGIADDDPEAMLVYGLAGLYDQYGDIRGLGDPATGTAVSSAMATITAIIQKIKKIFSAAKTVVDKVKSATSTVKNAVNTAKNVANTAKNTVSAVKTTAQAVKSGNITKAISTVATTAANVKNTATNTKNAVTSTVSTVKSTPSTVKNAVTTAASTVKSAVTSIPSTVKAATTAAKTAATSTVKNAVNTVKTTAANTVKSAVNTAKTTAANTVKSAVNTAKTTAANTVKSAVNTAKTTAANTVKSAVNTAKTTAANTVKSAVNTAKTTAANTVKSAVNTAKTTAANTVKSAVNTAKTTAANTVKSAVNTAKTVVSTPKVTITTTKVTTTPTTTTKTTTTTAKQATTTTTPKATSTTNATTTTVKSTTTAKATPAKTATTTKATTSTPAASTTATMATAKAKTTQQTTTAAQTSSSSNTQTQASIQAQTTTTAQQQTATAATATPTATTAAAAQQQAAATTKSSKLKWILGGAAILLTGGLVYYFSKNKNK